MAERIRLSGRGMAGEAGAEWRRIAERGEIKSGEREEPANGRLVFSWSQTESDGDERGSPVGRDKIGSGKAWRGFHGGRPLGIGASKVRGARQ